MRRIVLALAAMVLSTTTLTAGEIKIAWYGQSMFLIVTPKGTRVVTDPQYLEAYRQVNPIKADLILMSHQHNDHTRLEGIEDAKSVKQVNAIKKGASFDLDQWNEVDEKFKDVRYQSIPSYHDAVSGMQRGKNGCWIIDIDGIRIVHLGDLGHTLNKTQLKKLGKVDVLLVPVGGVYTLNGLDAFKVVKQINPKRHIIPMHYGTIVYDDLLPVKTFTDECKENELSIVNFKERTWLRIDTTADAPKKADVCVMSYLGAPLDFKLKPKK